MTETRPSLGGSFPASAASTIPGTGEARGIPVAVGITVVSGTVAGVAASDGTAAVAAPATIPFRTSLRSVPFLSNGLSVDFLDAAKGNSTGSVVASVIGTTLSLPASNASRLAVASLLSRIMRAEPTRPFISSVLRVAKSLTKFLTLVSEETSLPKTLAAAFFTAKPSFFLVLKSFSLNELTHSSAASRC